MFHFVLSFHSWEKRKIVQREIVFFYVIFVWITFDRDLFECLNVYHFYDFWRRFLRDHKIYDVFAFYAWVIYVAMIKSICSVAEKIRIFRKILGENLWWKFVTLEIRFVSPNIFYSVNVSAVVTVKSFFKCFESKPYETLEKERYFVILTPYEFEGGSKIKNSSLSNIWMTPNSLF